MSWKIFSSAPHRLYFFAGAIQGVLAIAWWIYDLAARYTNLFAAANWSITSVWAHAFLMIYGFFPFFIFGFLMTAAPNWVNGEKVKRAHYVPGFLFMAAGIVMFYPALLVGKLMLVISDVMYLAGWLISAGALLNIIVASPAGDKGHAFIVIGNVFIGWLGALFYLAWLLGGNQAWLQCAVVIGIWFFLLPIFLSVSHRMIPFFSSTALPNYEPRRPYPPLFILLGGMIIHAGLKLAGEDRYLWLIDLPMAIVAFYLSWLWKFGRSFSVRLLAMLHIGFAWLGLALTLYAVQSCIDFASGRNLLGMAPLHALTIGYFSSMVLAMVTRVTLGHSGHLPRADRTAWFLFLGFQFAAIARILGDLPFTGSSRFYLIAGTIWLACFALWDVKHLPIYWKQRIDGKHG